MSKKSSGLKLSSQLVKFSLLIICLGFLVFWVNPNLIPQPDLRDRWQIFKANLTQSSFLFEKASSLATFSRDKFMLLAKTIKLPKQVTGLPDEVVVEDAVIQLTEKLKSLPEKQAKTVKRNFCADIVAESAGEVAGSLDQ